MKCNRVSENDVDAILREYQGYIDEVKETHPQQFTKCDPVISRVDTLMVETMADKKSYAKLCGTGLVKCYVFCHMGKLLWKVDFRSISGLKSKTCS